MDRKLIIQRQKDFWTKQGMVDGAIVGKIEQPLEEVVDIFLENISKDFLRNATLLDVGCGEGRHSSTFAKRVEHYVGVDISRTCLDTAKERTKEMKNCEFFILDRLLSELFGKRKFHIVFSMYVFQHMPRWMLSEYFDNIYKIMADGGYFNFNLPSYSGVVPQIPNEDRFDMIADGDCWGVRWYPQWLVGKMIEDTGFVLEGLSSGMYFRWMARKPFKNKIREKT